MAGILFLLSVFCLKSNQGTGAYHVYIPEKINWQHLKTGDAQLDSLIVGEFQILITDTPFKNLYITGDYHYLLKNDSIAAYVELPTVFMLQLNNRKFIENKQAQIKTEGPIENKKNFFIKRLSIHDELIMLNGVKYQKTERLTGRSLRDIFQVIRGM